MYKFKGSFINTKAMIHLEQYLYEETGSRTMNRVFLILHEFSVHIKNCNNFKYLMLLVFNDYLENSAKPERLPEGFPITLLRNVLTAYYRKSLKAQI